MNAGAREFDAIVLAADRGPADPVARAAGVPAKCLAPIAGTPMVARVVGALEQSDRVHAIVLCGPPAEVLHGSAELTRLVEEHRLKWTANGATPSTSAALALSAVPADRRVLLTTGDHALLSPAMVRHFLDRAGDSDCDVVVALAPYPMVQAAYPDTRRTVLKFSDGRFCSCNLFAFLTPRGRELAQVWTQVEAQRKKPIRVVGLVGFGAMALYAVGRLSLQGALRRLSNKMRLRLGVVEMPFAEASIDVDKVDDLDLVRRIAQRQA